MSLYRREIHSKCLLLNDFSLCRLFTCSTFAHQMLCAIYCDESSKPTKQALIELQMIFQQHKFQLSNSLKFKMKKITNQNQFCQIKCKFEHADDGNRKCLHNSKATEAVRIFPQWFDSCVSYSVGKTVISRGRFIRLLFLRSLKFEIER